MEEPPNDDNLDPDETPSDPNEGEGTEPEEGKPDEHPDGDTPEGPEEETGGESPDEKDVEEIDARPYVVVGREMQTYLEPITDTRRELLARELVSCELAKDQLEREKKAKMTEFTQGIKDFEGRIRNLSVTLDGDTEETAVSCEWRVVPGDSIKRLVRTDVERVLDTQIMTLDEIARYQAWEDEQHPDDQEVFPVHPEDLPTPPVSPEDQGEGWTVGAEGMEPPSGEDGTDPPSPGEDPQSDAPDGDVPPVSEDPVS
jgi:hypothetical protein